MKLRGNSHEGIFLSLCMCLCVACGGDDDPSPQSSGSESENTQTSTTPDPGSTGSTPGSEQGTESSAPGSETNGETETGEGTDTEATGGTESEVSSGPPATPCEARCAVEVACPKVSCFVWGEDLDTCITECEANLVEAMDWSPQCNDAWEGIEGCIGTLSCEEYTEYCDAAVKDYPCFAEAEIHAIECAGQS